MPTLIPFDLTQNDALNADWREGFCWPLPANRLYDIHAQLWQRFLRFASDLDDDHRDLALLGRTAALDALVEAAFLVQAEKGQPFLYGPPELDILRGVETPADRGTAGHHGKTGTLRHRVLRQIARTASWSSAATLLPNLLAPRGIALSHNSLLRDYIKRNACRVGFRHGDVFLEQLLAASSTSELTIDIRGLIERFLSEVIAFEDLDDDIQKRLRDLLRPALRDSFEIAANTITTLRSVKSLPDSIWTGTGARGPGRAIGLEVLRRGGEAWRFDHGGTAALSDALAPFIVSELSVSSHVVMPTPEIAKSGAMAEAKAEASAFRPVEILGHSGDPGLDVGAAAFRNTRSPEQRRRVLYVSTAFYGFFQTSTPVMPGVPYLEWQLRLIEALQNLPIDLVCKPHPEGLLRGKVPPVEKLARVSNEPFEAALEFADILVMDFPASTTFSIALTTDRPIVLFDFGLVPFNGTFADKVNYRCRIIKPKYNAANQPLFDEKELAEAVCGGDDVANPDFFRTLFLGTP